MDPEKKISFGFSKLSKKPQLLSKKPLEEKKVELIESFEGNTIKVKDAIEEPVKKPLVIPIKENQKNILDRIKNARSQGQVENNVKDPEVEDTRPDSELTLDELAAREVIKDAKRRLEQGTEARKVFVLPIKEEKIAEGEPESTLEDYENIPISDYGMAMLRGMGWKEGMAIGKNQSKSGKLAEAPELRPKGLGLGASKLVKTEAGKAAAKDKDGQELVLKRGALAKIIAGAHRGNYCEVQGFDDEAGRVIVKTALKGEILTLHEFLVIAVTKEDYARNSKILNTAKYEEYKEKQEAQRDTHEDKVKTERFEDHKRSSKPPQKYKVKSESGSDNEDDRNRRRLAVDDNRSRGRTPEESSSNRRQSSPDVDRGRRRSRDRSSKHNGKAQRRNHSDSDTSSDSEYERRKKHHKKKDKRSRRDRSRSSSRKKSSKKSSRSKRQSSSPDSAYEESYSKSKSSNRSRSSRRRHSGRRSS